jgi:hypothetical protein
VPTDGRDQLGHIYSGHHDSTWLSLGTARYMCAGFVVQGARVTLCAPIFGCAWPLATVARRVT